MTSVVAITFATCAFFLQSRNLSLPINNVAIALFIVTFPFPEQVGHTLEFASIKLLPILCLDISNRPNSLILPICTLTLSCQNAFFNCLSTNFLFCKSSISIKSITINPDNPLNLTCLAISSVASRLMFRAVFSILYSSV